MSYVHPFSKRCDKSEVDLFRVPPTQQSLERGRWIDYAPISSVQNPDNAITFLIAGTDEYIDLSKTILTVTGNIMKKDGTTKLDGGAQSNVAPVNNFLHSLFRQVDVYLNGKQVTPAMGTYAYRSYIETLLNYDVSAKQSQFSSALYYKDTAGKMDGNGSLPSIETLNYKKSCYQRRLISKISPPRIRKPGFCAKAKVHHKWSSVCLIGTYFFRYIHDRSAFIERDGS